MDSKTYDIFFEALNKIVNEAESVQDKKAALQEAMGDQDETNLQELASWFYDL